MSVKAKRGQKMGWELKFISRIKRDGSGTIKIENDEEVAYHDGTVFNINCLSVTHGTFIASEFNSYVVKLKGKDKEE